MKQIEDIVLGSHEGQGQMEEYIAEVCLELNKMSANSTNVNTDDLISKLVPLIEYCDKVLIESEENKMKINSTLNEIAMLETRLHLEKKTKGV